MAAGFNGARLHQKVFEERFLYQADRLGYLVWGEFRRLGLRRVWPAARPPAAHRQLYHPVAGSAGSATTRTPASSAGARSTRPGRRITDRITVLDDVTLGMFLATKAMDPTRPVLDASGYSHRVPETDVYDCHDYEQDPVSFGQPRGGRRASRSSTGPGIDAWSSMPYRGQPYFVSEFGGIWWNPDAKPGEASWGYGDRPQSLDEFYTRFEGLCDALLDDPAMFGYCYTQLTDVFQEQNGIFRFDRSAKFDLERLQRIQTRKAASGGL